jgi:hypothetical protein
VSEALGVIGGGFRNTIGPTGPYGLIGNGGSNTVLSCYSTILNGFNNRISGVTNCYSFIGGGSNNRISNVSYGNILGGNFNVVNHACSFIIGDSISTVRTCTTHLNRLYLKNIQTGSGGLVAGEVYKDASGFLKIV